MVPLLSPEPEVLSGVAEPPEPLVPVVPEPELAARGRAAAFDLDGALVAAGAAAGVEALDLERVLGLEAASAPS